MSNQALYLKSAFVSTHLHNGIGRYIPQLKRITFKFCKSSGASRGVRDFIERDLINLAEEFPSVAIYAKPRRHRHPVVKAEYMDGTEQWMSFNKLEREVIVKWVYLFMRQSTGEHVRLNKRLHTDFPSIQGVWHPYMYTDPRFNITKLPNAEFSRAPLQQKSATELLIEMFKKQLSEEEKEKAEEEKQEIDAKLSKEKSNQ